MMQTSTPQPNHFARRHRKILLITTIALIFFAAWSFAGFQLGGRIQQKIKSNIACTKNLLQDHGLYTSTGSFDIDCSAMQTGPAWHVNYIMHNVVLPTSIARLNWQATLIRQNAAHAGIQTDFFPLNFKMVGNIKFSLLGSSGEMTGDFNVSPSAQQDAEGRAFDIHAQPGHFIRRGDSLLVDWTINEATFRDPARDIALKNLVFKLDYADVPNHIGKTETSLEQLSGTSKPKQLSKASPEQSAALAPVTINNMSISSSSNKNQQQPTLLDTRAEIDIGKTTLSSINIDHAKLAILVQGIGLHQINQPQKACPDTTALSCNANIEQLLKDGLTAFVNLDIDFDSIGPHVKHAQLKDNLRFEIKPHSPSVAVPSLDSAHASAILKNAKADNKLSLSASMLPPAALAYVLQENLGVLNNGQVISTQHYSPTKGIIINGQPHALPDFSPLSYATPDFKMAFSDANNPLPPSELYPRHVEKTQP